MRVLRENIAQESAENDTDPENLNFEPATDMNDDKLFAAMGIAKTLSTVIYSFTFLLVCLTLTNCDYDVIDRVGR